MPVLVEKYSLWTFVKALAFLFPCTTWRVWSKSLRKHAEIYGAMRVFQPHIVVGFAYLWSVYLNFWLLWKVNLVSLAFFCKVFSPVFLHGRCLFYYHRNKTCNKRQQLLTEQLNFTLHWKWCEKEPILVGFSYLLCLHVTRKKW